MSLSITLVKSLIDNPRFAVIAIAESILTERNVSEKKGFLLCEKTFTESSKKNKTIVFFNFISGYKQQILANGKNLLFELFLNYIVFNSATKSVSAFFASPKNMLVFGL